MFEFAWPLSFLLLPLPWLYRRLLPAAQTRSAALQVSFMSRLQELQSLSPEIRSAGRKWPHVVVWLLLVMAAARPQWLRSEEHTSELQSRPHLVCRLLLEKKNK